MESTHPRRRLATILAADVVGYSRLMAADEEATVRTLRAHREVIDRLIARHDGRIFNTGGDSVLAEFGSAVEAVRCAITIQDELRVRNAEMPPERRLEFRVGINVGDVLVQEDNDLLGDGVNVAARLESLARPGGICISGSTFEQVKNKLSVGFENLGPQQVKNIPEPVAAFSVTSAPVTLAAAPGSGQHAGRLRLAAAAAATIAVMAAAGIWFFGLRDEGARPLSDFADNVTSETLSAGDIEALMAGVTISGHRALDGEPFSIVLNPDRTASYSYGGDGTAYRVTGRWWTDDHRFCMEVPKFARGQQACPRIEKHGATLTAVRPRDNAVLPWTLVK